MKDFKDYSLLKKYEFLSDRFDDEQILLLGSLFEKMNSKIKVKRGKDGKDGLNGKDGKDGKDGKNTKSCAKNWDTE